MAGDVQGPSGTGFDPSPQFWVDRAESTPGSLAVVGRCFFGPIRTGLVFDGIVPARNGSWSRSDVVACRLRVAEVHVFGRPADGIDQVMSGRLVAGGFTVHGHDISPSARAALADAGGLAHDNLGDAVRDASLVILMLPSSDVVEAVVRDPQFALAAGTTVVDMSSSEPSRTQALAAELAQRGITLVDAPVSGGVTGARAGSLTIMVGADAMAVDRLRPVFEPIGNPVSVGGVGAAVGHPPAVDGRGDGGRPALRSRPAGHGRRLQPLQRAEPVDQ